MGGNSINSFGFSTYLQIFLKKRTSRRGTVDTDTSLLCHSPWGPVKTEIFSVALLMHYGWERMPRYPVSSRDCSLCPCLLRLVGPPCILTNTTHAPGAAHSPLFRWEVRGLERWSDFFSIIQLIKGHQHLNPGLVELEFLSNPIWCVLAFICPGLSLWLSLSVSTAE